MGEAWEWIKEWWGEPVSSYTTGKYGAIQRAERMKWETPACLPDVMARISRPSGRGV